MRYILLVSTLSFLLKTSGQSARIGSIDIYGNRKISSTIIYTALPVKEGDSISHEDFKSEEVAGRLEHIPQVLHATVNPVCCDPNGNLMLYIGIGETDSVLLKHREAPKQKLVLPGAMMKAYHDLTNLVDAAIKYDGGKEDDSLGYALVAYKPARHEQDKFIQFASQNLPVLINVLKNSADGEQRAAAAQIIAYSADQKRITGYLLYAVNDPDEEVRNNATRALFILAGFGRLHPELKIDIPATPFIKMMNSIVWTDRNKGASVLMQLTQSRNAALLNEIKQQALPSVIEMARWKDRSHAFFSFMILGRIAGIEEKILIDKNNAKDYNAEVDDMVEKCYQERK